MELIGMKHPCIIDRRFVIEFGNEFRIRAVIRPFHTGGLQTIFCKRIPQKKGEVYGVVLNLRGTVVQLMTRAQGDKTWYWTRSGRGHIQAQETYEIVAVRTGNRGRIFIEGIDRTHPDHCQAAMGDLNNHGYAFIGTMPLAGKAIHPFDGQIKAIAFYNDQREIKPEDTGKASEWKQLKRDPVQRMSLGQIRV
jgi:hypothetical protein